MASISSHLRRAVAEHAKNRCEYCQSPELITGGPLHVDHIIPEVSGGLAILDNLALACARCNLYKGVRFRFRDPVTRQTVSLFNPRTQKWSRHFSWSTDGVRIIGRTRSGRATIVALQMNHPTIVMSRSLWVSLDIHPPQNKAK